MSNHRISWSELIMRVSTTTEQVLQMWVTSDYTFVEVLRVQPYQVQRVVLRELKSLGVLCWNNGIPSLSV
jgi:hypothetical protein